MVSRISNFIRSNKKRFDAGFAVISLMIVMTLFLLSCPEPHLSPTESPLVHGGKPRIIIANLELQIHKLINDERNQHGLHLLAWDDTLARIARRHSSEMARRRYFDHVSPEDHDFSYRFRQEGYRCSISVGTTRYLGGENIFQNYLYEKVSRVNGEAFYDWNSRDKIAETTVQGWMNSPGHRENILMPYWNHEGIGVVIAPRW